MVFFSQRWRSFYRDTKSVLPMNLILFTGPHRSKPIYLIKENNGRSHAVGLEQKHRYTDILEKESAWEISWLESHRFFRLASGITTNWANGITGMNNRRQQPASTHWDWVTGNKSHQQFLQLLGKPWEQSQDLIQFHILEASFFHYEFKWPCFQPASVSL